MKEDDELHYDITGKPEHHRTDFDIAFQTLSDALKPGANHTPSPRSWVLQWCPHTCTLADHTPTSMLVAGHQMLRSPSCTRLHWSCAKATSTCLRVRCPPGALAMQQHSS